MGLTIDALLATPDHYLQAFDGEAALFVPMNRSTYHRSIFLDHRIQTAAEQATRIPLAALGGLDGSLALNWIFHMAHGGSTLLARALDRVDGNLVLREPVTVRQLALEPVSGLLSAVLTLLARRYRPDLPTIVKANVPVNFLLPDLVGPGHLGRSLILYHKLPDYLLAILRSSGHRNWLRSIVDALSDQMGDLGALSDAECAAAFWLAQMQEFAAAVTRSPAARTLDAEILFAEPRRALTAASAHLEAPMDALEIEAITAGPLFATYSKNPAIVFDNTARIARRDGLARQLADDLAQAAAWIDHRRDTADRALAAVKMADILVEP